MGPKVRRYDGVDIFIACCSLVLLFRCASFFIRFFLCASLNLHSFTTLLQRLESAIVVLPLHTFPLGLPGATVGIDIYSLPKPTSFATTVA